MIDKKKKEKKEGSSYIEKLKTISLGLCTFFLTDVYLGLIMVGQKDTRF